MCIRQISSGDFWISILSSSVVKYSVERISLSVKIELGHKLVISLLSRELIADAEKHV